MGDGSVLLYIEGSEDGQSFDLQHEFNLVLTDDPAFSRVPAVPMSSNCPVIIGSAVGPLCTRTTINWTGDSRARAAVWRAGCAAETGVKTLSRTGGDSRSRRL